MAHQLGQWAPGLRRFEQTLPPRKVFDMTALRGLVLALVLVVGVGAPVTAQDRPGRPDAPAQQRGQRGPQREQGPGVLRLLPSDSVTDKSVATASGPIAYTATAGTLMLHDQTGEQSAAVFYVAYVAKDRDPATRPVTFVFNGGPGA